VAATAGAEPEPEPDPALAIRLHRATKEMELGKQFGVGTDGVGTDGVGTDEIDNSYESARSAPSAPSVTTNCGKIDTNCGKIDAEERGDTTGVNTPFHLEQKKRNCRTNRKANRRKANRKASIMWALLMARIFEVMPLKCPHCGQVINIISFITHKTLIQKILGHLGLPAEPPKTAPARSPVPPKNTSVVAIKGETVARRKDIGGFLAKGARHNVVFPA
jgi:hypothetical protein